MVIEYYERSKGNDPGLPNGELTGVENLIDPYKQAADESVKRKKTPESLCFTDPTKEDTEIWRRSSKMTSPRVMSSALKIRRRNTT